MKPANRANLLGKLVFYILAFGEADYGLIFRRLDIPKVHYSEGSVTLTLTLTRLPTLLTLKYETFGISNLRNIEQLSREASPPTPPASPVWPGYSW